VSFVIDFAAQQYGMLSTPNMKDIYDANLSFFSPQFVLDCCILLSTAALPIGLAIQIVQA
jgi:hypothetical protein